MVNAGEMIECVYEKARLAVQVFEPTLFADSVHEHDPDLFILVRYRLHRAHDLIAAVRG
jgi:hypothetical protein